MVKPLRCFRRLLLLFLTGTMLYACNGNRRAHTEIAEHQLTGREIQLSGLLPFNMPEGATLEWLLKKAKHSIVVYIDSSGCEDCNIYHAIGIRGYELELKERQRDDIPFIYIFNTQDMEALQERLRNYGFYHCYFIDFAGAFLDSNGIPSDNRYHTFLLKDRKVQVIGNPATSQKVRDAYNRALTLPK